MEEKKIYRIIDNDCPEEPLYVLLTETQVRTIEKFIRWAELTYNYSIKENDNFIPVEW